MKTNYLFKYSIIFLFLIVTISCQKQQKQTEIPHLQKHGIATQLIVDGKPFLILGGELHNSSASSIAYMQSVWPKLTQKNLNTVLATISWEQFETKEGTFDYSLIDDLLVQARKNKMRLIILWLGSWKNGTSGYIPEWVKLDQKRFPRVKDKNNHTLEILSVFSEESVKADAKVFAKLMARIKEKDAATHSVIMVQVENEVGVHSDSRDRSLLANEAFSRPVPRELTDYLQRNRNNLIIELDSIWNTYGSKTSGSWENIFGKGPAADEIFMCWNYARYINRVAEAGKAEYPLPMFVNNWLVQPEDKIPGDYPSGGPVGHLLDIWKAGAPKIDILSPDIYLDDFKGTVAKFTRAGNPLFIPESKAGKIGAANAFYAIGNFNSMGYSPFGIDGDRGKDDTIPKAYALLAKLTPLILRFQGTDSIAALVLDTAKFSQILKMGEYDICVTLQHNHHNPKERSKLGYGMVMMVHTKEYIVAGNDIEVTFTPNKSDSIAALLSVQEGTFNNGIWIPGRLLNGDEVQIRYDLGEAAKERLSGTGLMLKSEKYDIQRVKLYNYK
jgi:hypothetical protein